MRTSVKYLFTALACLVAISCGADGGSVEMVEYDVSYGPDPQHKMDVSFVAGRDLSTPLVVLVHGGGWMSGDKRDAGFMRDACFANGINVVNLNYRLGNEHIHYEEMMQDMGMAMEYVSARTDEWKIRDSRIVMWGGSAGAHLALLYAYAYDERDAVSLVITLGAPTKLNSFASMEGAKPQDMEGLLPIITGKPWSYDESLLDEAYRLASPYYAPNLKPTLLVHGGADDIVPVAQSELMSRRLREAGVADSLIVLPGGGHGGENTPEEYSESLNRTMYEWIIKYSK